MRAPARSYVTKNPRSSALYYVRDVPADVRAKIGQGRWKISLQTANRAEATRKAHVLAVEHDEIIAAARRPAPIETLNPEDRARIQKAGGVEPFLTDLNDLAGQTEDLRLEARAIDGAPIEGWDVPGHWPTSESGVDDDGKPLNGTDVPDPDYSPVRLAGIRTETQAIQSRIAREAPVVGHLEVPSADLKRQFPALATALASTPHDPNTITLSGALAAWERQKKPQAPEQYRWPVKLFEDKFGCRPIREITKADMREFRDLLLTIAPAPGVANKGVSLAELQSRVKNGVAAISQSTATKYLRSIGTILRFAVADGYLENSPAEGIGYHKKREKFAEAKDQRRRSLSPVEVAALLATASALPSAKIETAWFVRLMLYTGARGEELSQLAPSDIREHRGIRYLRIHDEGLNKLKNSSSLRLIPIHQALLDAGFMQFVESRGVGDYVFRTLEADSRDRRYTRMQRRLTTLIRTQAKIDDERVVPHSLRHTFKDALRMAGAPDEVADRLMGHTQPGRAVPTGYGNPDQVAVLAPWLDKVDPLDANRLVSAFDDHGEGTASDDSIAD